MPSSRPWGGRRTPRTRRCAPRATWGRCREGVGQQQLTVKQYLRTFTELADSLHGGAELSPYTPVRASCQVGAALGARPALRKAMLVEVRGRQVSGWSAHRRPKVFLSHLVPCPAPVRSLLPAPTPVWAAAPCTAPPRSRAWRTAPCSPRSPSCRPCLCTAWPAARRAGSSGALRGRGSAGGRDMGRKALRSGGMRTTAVYDEVHATTT